MDVSIYMKGYYEQYYDFGLRKNKPNSKPNKLVLSAVEWSQSVRKELPDRFYGGLRQEIRSSKSETKRMGAK